ncbi:MAG: ribosome maturation factor RimP [Nitrospirae bacterium]|nr:ribosome maturation factor RimP [Nitrospirota bacterium]
MLDTKQKIYGLASQAAEAEGLELVDIIVSGKGRMLVRVIIDREPDGVAIEDCERMSRSLEALLDVEDAISSSYMLEVSSPGIDRPLIKPKDFEKNIGRLARVVTKEPLNGQTFFFGRLVDVGEGWVRLRPEKSSAQKPHAKKISKPSDGKDDIFIPFDLISKAKLEIEIGRPEKADSGSMPL